LRLAPVRVTFRAAPPRNPAMQQIRHFFSGFDLRSTGKWFVLSGLVGVIAGLGAIALQLLLGATTRLFLAELCGYSPVEAAAEPSWFSHEGGELSVWMLVPVLVFGGLVSGWLVYTFAPEAEGHGTDAAIEAFHEKRGNIATRVPLVKMLASAVTIGTGGSGGREGPIAQIGAGFGSFLGHRLGLSARDRRLMLAAGMGAGVGAIFRAPLAGALFAGEILYKDADIESDAVVPSAISSIVGYSVYSLALPEDTRFSPLFGPEAHDFGFSSLLELLPLTALAFALVLVGILYIKVFYGTHHLFAKLPVQKRWRPAIGAGLAGLFAVALFYGFHGDLRSLAVLSAGYGAIQSAMSSSTELGVGILLAIAFGKILTTSLTIGSGGSGGVFGPSMVIGGCLGAAVGGQFHRLWPDIVVQPRSYVVVGMAGFFAGIAHAPFSTIVMVSEMTGDYRLLLPSMWVSMICFLLCRRWTLYVKQVPSRLESQALSGDFIVDVLGGVRVEDVYRKTSGDLCTFHPSARLEQIVHEIAETRQNYFPVFDGERRMVGIFSESDVRSYFYEEEIWAVAVAADAMVEDFLFLHPDDDLNMAMRRFTQRNIDELPVLDRNEPGKLLGMLRRRETIAYYNSRVAELKSQADSAS